MKEKLLRLETFFVAHRNVIAHLCLCLSHPLQKEFCALFIGLVRKTKTVPNNFAIRTQSHICLSHIFPPFEFKIINNNQIVFFSPFFLLHSNTKNNNAICQKKTIRPNYPQIAADGKKFFHLMTSYFMIVEKKKIYIFEKENYFVKFSDCFSLFASFDIFFLRFFVGFFFLFLSLSQLNLPKT